MSFEYAPRLFEILPEIEAWLIAKPPRAIRKKRMTEPAYAVFLWYHDSSSDGDFAPYCGAALDSIRAECAKRYEDRADANFCIWCPQQNMDELTVSGWFNDVGLDSLCNEAYALMLAANKTGLPLMDEGEILLPLRQMMHRVAQRLNSLDWSDVLPTTDDFMVVSTNTIGYWDAEDLQCSIPEAKLAVLRERGLLLWTE